MFKNVDGRTTKPCYTISSTCEPLAQVSFKVSWGDKLLLLFFFFFFFSFFFLLFSFTFFAKRKACYHLITVFLLHFRSFLTFNIPCYVLVSCLRLRLPLFPFHDLIRTVLDD